MRAILGGCRRTIDCELAPMKAHGGPPAETAVDKTELQTYTKNVGIYVR